MSRKTHANPLLSNNESKRFPCFDPYEPKQGNCFLMLVLIAFSLTIPNGHTCRRAQCANHQQYHRHGVAGISGFRSCTGSSRCGRGRSCRIVRIGSVRWGGRIGRIRGIRRFGRIGWVRGIRRLGRVGRILDRVFRAPELCSIERVRSSDHPIIRSSCENSQSVIEAVTKSICGNGIDADRAIAVIGNLIQVKARFGGAQILHRFCQCHQIISGRIAEQHIVQALQALRKQV